MHAVRLTFLQMLTMIRRDMMLLAVCLAPFLTGIAIKFGIPLLESVLSGWLGQSGVLTPYYSLFDLFFAMIAPTMFCFLSAMVMLEEHDSHIERALFVTRLRRGGYLTARILIPAVIAFVFTAVFLPVFRLTSFSLFMTVAVSFTGAMQGCIIALMIVTLSSNQLEGVAVTKLSSLTILGAAVPFFVSSPLQYLLSVLPSFWMGIAMREGRLSALLPACITGIICTLLLLRQYSRKLS